MNVNALIATFFGVGRAPFAPGTFGSLAALPFAWLLADLYGHWWLAAFGLGLGVIGIVFADGYSKQIGDSDPPSCVIDEVAGQWIALAAVPPTFLAYFIGFVLFRWFDIKKVWPADKAEMLPGGLGIIADDIVAGVMAGLAVNLLVIAGYLP